MSIDDPKRSSNRPRRSCRVGQVGFTLIELIMVMVILGILAVYAVPRIFNSNDFYARGFHDETLSILRYAQKTAIAQRRTVCVVFSAPSPASATLTIASAAASYTCNTSSTGPNKSCPGGPTGPTGCITGRTDVAYSGTPTNFNFDGLGQPIKADGTGAAQTTQTIQVANAAKSITVEAATGYVHE